jgi:hypothetical protein
MKKDKLGQLVKQNLRWASQEDDFNDFEDLLEISTKREKINRNKQKSSKENPSLKKD